MKVNWARPPEVAPEVRVRVLPLPKVMTFELKEDMVPPYVAETAMVAPIPPFVATIVDWLMVSAPLPNPKKKVEADVAVLVENESFPLPPTIEVPVRVVAPMVSTPSPPRMVELERVPV